MLGLEAALPYPSYYTNSEDPKGDPQASVFAIYPLINPHSTSFLPFVNFLKYFIIVREKNRGKTLIDTVISNPSYSLFFVIQAVL